MTFGLIDIGSNSVRLSVYAIGKQADEMRGRIVDVTSDDLGSFVRLFSKKVMAQLASYVDDDNCLTDDGVDNACRALAYLVSVVENLSIDRVYAFATASLRNVDNSEDVLERIERRTGLAIELLSGEEEAMLGYSSFRHERDVDEGIVVDIGGGSAELTCFSGDDVEESASMPLGSLKLFKREVEGILPTKKESRAIRDSVSLALDDAGFEDPEPRKLLCGIGGTSRAIAKIMRREGVCGEESAKFSRDDLGSLIRTFVEDDRESRDIILRTCPERIHTLVPGALELWTIVKRFDVEEIIVGKHGVREGYVYERIIG